MNDLDIFRDFDLLEEDREAMHARSMPSYADGPLLIGVTDPAAAYREMIADLYGMIAERDVGDAGRMAIEATVARMERG